MNQEMSQINAAYQKIKDLIEEEKWVDAHRGCIEILRFDPENIKVIRLKNKIEAKVRKMNIDALKDDLKNLQPLWRERNFPALMSNLKLLDPYLNQYAPLKKFMLTVQKAYQAHLSAEQEKYYRQEIEQIKQLAKNKYYQEAMRQGEKLRILNLHYEEVKSLIQKIKDEWIDYEISKKQQLLDSEKYEEIILFYQELQRIDGRSEKLKRLIETNKKKAQGQRVEEKRDFIYSSLEKINTLFQLKKFESAMMASHEILEIDPENREAKKYYETAKVKVRKIIDKELTEQMTSAQLKMKEDYKLNKKNYIRL